MNSFCRNKNYKGDSSYYDQSLNKDYNEKNDNDKLGFNYKESNKNNYNNNQKKSGRKISETKESTSRKNSSIQEPIILVKSTKTLKEILDGK